MTDRLNYETCAHPTILCARSCRFCKCSACAFCPHCAEWCSKPSDCASSACFTCAACKGIAPGLPLRCEAWCRPHHCGAAGGACDECTACGGPQRPPPHILSPSPPSPPPRPSPPPPPPSCWPPPPPLPSPPPPPPLSEEGKPRETTHAPHTPSSAAEADARGAMSRTSSFAVGGGGDITTSIAPGDKFATSPSIAREEQSQRTSLAADGDWQSPRTSLVTFADATGSLAVPAASSVSRANALHASGSASTASAGGGSGSIDPYEIALRSHHAAQGSYFGESSSWLLRPLESWQFWFILAVATLCCACAARSLITDDKGDAARMGGGDCDTFPSRAWHERGGGLRDDDSYTSEDDSGHE